METTTHHRNSITVPTYTMGFKYYKVNGVKMREVKIYRNGAWIYGSKFKAEEREQREQWADNFMKAMRLHDMKLITGKLEQMKGI